MTEVQAQEIVTLLFAAFPAVRQTDEAGLLATAKVYRLGMLDLDYAPAKAVVTRLIGTHTLPFPPAIAVIRAAYTDATVGRRRTGADAWADVLKEIKATGQHRAPRLADPVALRVVRGLGWKEICQSTNLVADRARFIDAYESASAVAAQDRAVKSLRGAAQPRELPSGSATTLADAVRNALPSGGTDDDDKF